jgi:hypothetical protein
LNHITFRTPGEKKLGEGIGGLLGSLSLGLVCKSGRLHVAPSALDLAIIVAAVRVNLPVDLVSNQFAFRSAGET